MDPLFLLDTNILVHLVRGDAIWQRIVAQYAPLLADPKPILSIVTVGEIRSLALQFGWQVARLNQMQFALTCFPTVNIDHAVILDAYAMLDAYALSRGHTLGKNDLWIAATAHVMSAILLTTDRDFDILHPMFVQRIWVDPNLP